MKTGLFLICILRVVLAGSLLSSAQAQVTQEWVARYNYSLGDSTDSATSLVVDGDGNVYVTGRSYGGSGVDWDYATIKYNSTGAQQWVARYNGPANGDDEASSLAVDVGSYMYVTGFSYGSGTDKDYTTIRYDLFGNQMWAVHYNGPGNSYDFATSLAVDDGNVYISGTSAGSGTSSDYATIKYDTSGNQIWVARYNGPGNSWEDAYSLSVDNGGNVYVTGYSVGSGTLTDYATIKYDTNGNQIWVARYNGPGNNNDWATFLALDDDGNVYVTGRSTGSGSLYDYATIKYSAAGTQLWVRRYNGPGNSYDWASSLVLDGSGNVYVTGYSWGSGTSTDYATIKYDASGNQLWVVRYNGPANGDDEASSLAVDVDGNVYVTGYSVGGVTFTDYATVKYDSIGQQQWVMRFNGQGTGADFATSLVVDVGGKVYVTGYSYVYPGYDYATIKYNQSPGGVAPWAVEAPLEFTLKGVHPNPFNPSTVISFELRAASYVNLSVFDLAGRLVATLVESWQAAGDHQVSFDGSHLPSGVYLYRLTARDFVGTGKMVLLK